MIVTLGAVAVGATLALVTTRGHVVLGALRTFAAIAVVATVLMQLLPEAVQELGIAALGAFVGALVLPRFVVLAASAIRRPRMSARGVGADLGFYGFLLHQWGEGLALGTFVSDGHAHGDLVLGMAAHTVPLTAVFVAATLAARGRRAALGRTGALLVATALGFAAAGTISASQVSGALPWLSAAVAGFLCHILLHDEGFALRRTALTGALDVIAGLAGVALPWLTMGSHPHDVHAGADGLREPLAHAFFELWAMTAPLLLVGLMLGAGLQVLGSRAPGRYLGSGGAARQAWRGLGIGASLPLCACGALPLADTLRRRGAGPALVVAFLMGAPELGPETLLLTVGFLGVPFAAMRLGAALLVAFVAALAFGRLAGAGARAGGPAPEPSGSMITGASPRQRQGWGVALDYFDELLLHIGPWVLVGLVAAAYVQAAIPPGSLAWLAERGLDVVVVALIAAPTFVCAASATPLAAVLLLEGISPGAVLVGLLMGPATNVASIAMLRRGYGMRVVGLGIGAMLGVSIGLGLLVNALELPVGMSSVHPESHGFGWVSTAATAALVVMLLRQLWRWGTHPWFEILDAGSHGHGHGHGEHDPDHHPEHHGHAHEHGHRHDHGEPAHEHHAPGDEHRHHHAHDHDHIPGLPDLDQFAPPSAPPPPLDTGERTDVET